MNEPSQIDIEKVKAALPDRAFKLITLAEKDGEELYFIATGPNKVEYEKIVEDMTKVEKEKTDLDKINGVRRVMEMLALQQIRWPDRPTVMGLFDKYPTISMQLGSKIREYAGDSFEVREKKL